MSVQIVRAAMGRDEDNHYIGKTVFHYSDHKAPYEITFFSKKGKDWDYSLSFAGEPGSEEQFLSLDALLETDDDLFDELLDAALDNEAEATEEP
ncbi:hypothetical protein [Paenibacillus tengchongensis]|uniref:hypothetical protein n=1 Tax=Paenibacillus tengchongensis TaxID=2608684 RepID=UPI00124D14C2|nr:hypothetical protein [Paenibacillus tengchongensis]